MIQIENVIYQKIAVMYFILYFALSVKWIARQFGNLLDKEPLFINEEQQDALLSNATECARLFGYPKVALKKIMELLVDAYLTAAT